MKDQFSALRYQASNLLRDYLFADMHVVGNAIGAVDQTGLSQQRARETVRDWSRDVKVPGFDRGTAGMPFELLGCLADRRTRVAELPAASPFVFCWSGLICKALPDFLNANETQQIAMLSLNDPCAVLLSQNSIDLIEAWAQQLQDYGYTEDSTLLLARTGLLRRFEDNRKVSDRFRHDRVYGLCFRFLTARPDEQIALLNGACADLVNANSITLLQQWAQRLWNLGDVNQAELWSDTVGVLHECSAQPIDRVAAYYHAVYELLQQFTAADLSGRKEILDSPSSLLLHPKSMQLVQWWAEQARLLGDITAQSNRFECVRILELCLSVGLENAFKLLSAKRPTESDRPVAHSINLRLRPPDDTESCAWPSRVIGFIANARFQEPTESLLLDQDERRRDSLLRLLKSNVQEARRLLSDMGSELVSPVVVASLRTWADQAKQRGDKSLEIWFSATAELLECCAQRGVAYVFEGNTENKYGLNEFYALGMNTYGELTKISNEVPLREVGTLKEREFIARKALALTQFAYPSTAMLWEHCSCRRQWASELFWLAEMTGDKDLYQKAIGQLRLALPGLSSPPGLKTDILLSIAGALRAMGAGNVDERDPSDGRIETHAQFLDLLRQVELPRGRGQYERIIVEYARTVLDIAFHLDDFSDRVLALDKAADLFMAALCEDSWLEPFEYTNIRAQLASVKQIQAVAKHEEKYLDDAIEMLREMRSQLVRGEQQAVYAHITLVLAKCLRTAARVWNLDTVNEAVALYRDALEIFARFGDEETYASAVNEISLLLLEKGNYASIVEFIDPAIEQSVIAIMDPSRSPVGRERAVERVSGLYSLLSLCKLRLKDINGALEAAETGRARLLADAFGLSDQRFEQVDIVARQELSLARQRVEQLRNSLGSVLVESKSTQYGVDYQDVTSRSPLSPEQDRRQQADLRDAYNDYLAKCRKHGLFEAPREMSAENIKKVVPDFGALVLPVLTPTEVFAFVIAREQIKVIELQNFNQREVMERLHGENGWFDTYFQTVRARDFVRFVTPRSSKRHPSYECWSAHLDDTLKWLWDHLLSLIDSHLCNPEGSGLTRGAAVILLAPGLLSILPLHAAGPNQEGERFCDRWNVSVVPSIRSLIVCSGRLTQRVDMPVKFLVLADAPAPNYRRLPGAREEATALKTHLSRIHPEILMDTEATVRAVEQSAREARFLHCAVHGEHDMYNPRRSCIVLADGHLSMERLLMTQIQARLVYMSACESGLSGIEIPEEFVGLASGFIQVGAACVIGSLWPVFDDSAFLIAKKFYELYLDTEGRELKRPNEALREALFWLRSVTFKQLRLEFPADASGGAASGLGILRLQLGRDDECPYASPHEWAGWVTTGV